MLRYHAVLHRSEFYRGMVMLDLPVLTLVNHLVIHAAKRFGFINRITLAGRILGYREALPDLEGVRAYFPGKAPFRRLDSDCLEAYVRHGLADNGGDSGLRLCFDPAIEISIYCSVPHSSPGRVRQLQVPLAMVHGRHSKVVLSHHTRLIRVISRGEFMSLPGDRMFPPKHPRETAELLKGVFGR